MPFHAADIVFADESKSGAYFVAAVAATKEDIGRTEKALRALRAGGRSTIHFNDESRRRDLLVRAFCELDVRVTVYVVKRARDVVARPVILRRLTEDLWADGASALVLERDESVEKVDRRVIRDHLARLDALHRLTYEHRLAREQPLLWVADAVAWCHQKGGAWPSKVAPIVVEVVHIDMT